MGNYPKMVKRRCLHKGWQFNGIIYVFGGDKEGTVETFDMAYHAISATRKWQIIPLKYQEFTQTEITMKSFIHA